MRYSVALLRRPHEYAKEIQDSRGIVRFARAVKFWPPNVQEARPARCVICDQGAYEGGRLWIHGHGLVDRQQRGPAAVGAPPSCEIVLVRRYLCRACATVMRVVPASCAARKHFSGGAIALALALYGACKSARQVRSQVNDWKRLGPAARGWRSLRRWIGAAAAGTLFAGLGLGLLTGSPRELAQRTAQALCGHAPVEFRSAPVEHQAQIGQSHVS